MRRTQFSSAPSAGGGGGAPLDATYVTLSTNVDLTSERVLTAGTGISIVDNGAGNTVVISTTGGVIPTFEDNETPTGLINGVNVTYTLANAPSPSVSLRLYRNGILQHAAGEDYTLVGNTITMVAAPITGDILRAWYRR